MTTLPRTIRTFEEFALCDVFVGDIDPTYWVMNRALHAKGRPWTTRFCVGMLAFYHMGTAEAAAGHEGQDFWEYLKEVFPTTPRASERRHFRGQKGLDALVAMEHFSPVPENFFEPFPPTYQGVKSVCGNKLQQFGPYFQLKVCDYMDRCLDIPIRSFAGLERNLPSFPLKAACMLTPGVPDYQAFNIAVQRVGQLQLLAPPKFDRPIGPAEVETILCDWKRAKTGSSWMGADIHDKYHALRKGSELQGWLPQLIKSDTFKLELL